MIRKVFKKSNRLIHHYCRTFAYAKSPYFMENQPYDFNVLPPGNVPNHIDRPNYISQKHFNYDNKSYAIHATTQEIENHRKSCRITAEVLQNVEDYNASKVNIKIIRHRGLKRLKKSIS